MMYADVVMEKAEDKEPAEGKGIRKILDDMLDEFKVKKVINLTPTSMQMNCYISQKNSKLPSKEFWEQNFPTMQKCNSKAV